MDSPGLMSTPRKVDMAITGKCNLDCAYCFFADEMTSRGDLPIETWLNFIDEMGRLGVMEVTMTGGEVFTRRELFTMIDRLIANRMRYRLLSNGTLITEKTMEEFAVGKRRSRLDSIQISIDGSTADIHDASRPKSFSRAIRGLRLLNDAGFPVTVRVTINRYNVDDIENIAKLLLEDIGIPNFTTNEAYPCGATSRFEDGIRLSTEQRNRVMQVLTDLSDKYEGRISASSGPLYFAKKFKEIEVAQEKGITSFPGGGTLSACGSAFTTLAVLHDGTIVPCTAVPTLTMGNIRTDSFENIWRNHETMGMMRKRREIPLGRLETCKGCKYQGYCSGGCPVGALSVGDGLDARNPYDCFRIMKGEDPSFKTQEPLEIIELKPR